MVAKPAESKESNIDLFKGKTFAFFGAFSYWPSYHPGAPSTVAQMKGGILKHDVDEGLNYLVIGDKREEGKKEAIKEAERLRAESEGTVASGKRKAKPATGKPFPTILNESAFRELVRANLTGKTFCLFGGFDCCGGGFDESLLQSMVENVGGVVVNALDEKLDYAVFGPRKSDGKIAASNKAKKLAASGIRLKILDEEGFLELVRTDHDTTSGDDDMNFATFISRLHGTVDQGKLGRALKMLKQEAFKLYVRKDDEHVVGVVRSQTNTSKVYASWLTPEGKYGCCTPDLDECMGLQGNICKHLLVLMVGLTGAGEMEARQAYDWLKAAQGKRPRANGALIADTFIQYKGAEVGEIDWRPTETIPEDYYAF